MLYPDGTGVDKQESDDVLYVQDVQTGELFTIAPNRISELAEATDPQTVIAEREEAIAAATNQEIEQEEGAASGTAAPTEAPEVRIPAPRFSGARVTLDLPNGSSVNGVVLQVTPDGVEVQTDSPVNGRFVQVFPTDEFDGMLSSVRDEADDVIWSREVAEPVDVEEENQNDAAANGQQREMQGNGIPVDAKTGEPVYDAVAPDVAWDAIVQEAEGDEAMAMQVVTDIVADMEAKVQKAKKAKVRSGSSVREKLEAQKEHKRQIEEAEAQLEAWRRIAAVKAERIAAAERAKIEAAQQREVMQDDETEVPDFVFDKPENARERGYRMQNGQRADRQEPIAAAVGKEVSVKFTHKVSQPVRVAVVDARSLQPSHQNGQPNVLHFLPEAQPKKRTDHESVNAAEQMAAHMNPEEITSSVTAYTGAPSVNARGEVIQGNNRTAALKRMWQGYPEQAAAYKQYLMNHASEYGLNPEDIAAMEQPVLVNLMDVTDEQAIELGQYDVKDTESGGTERIKPRNVSQKMGDKAERFASILLRTTDEDASVSQLIDEHAVETLKWLEAQHYISPTQYRSAFNADGQVTPEAKNDLRGILYQAVFKNGSERLEDMFNALPAKAQRAILATAYRDFSTPESEKMLPEIQNSIVAFYELSQDAAFANAKNFEEARKATMAWLQQMQFDFSTGQSVSREGKYTNFALTLAAMYKVQTQTAIQQTFNDMFDLLQGRQQPDLLFNPNPNNTPRTLAEAIREVLNIEYDGTNGSHALGDNNETRTTGRQGSARDDSAGGTDAPGNAAADAEGGTERDKGRVGTENEGRGNKEKENDETEVIGSSMTADEALDFIADMELGAEIAPEIDLTIENWDALFGKEGIVSTPIGNVKMGENQFTKLMRQGRNGKLGMIKPTLEHPHAIIADVSEAKEGDITERASSYVFIRSFKKVDGSRYYYFTSITVSKDGKEVVISNQEKRRNAIANLLTKGKLVWKHADDVSDASDMAQGLYSSQGNVSDLATEGTDAPQTTISSTGKDTPENRAVQTSGQENAETSSEGGISSISHAENQSAPAISLQSRGDVVSISNTTGKDTPQNSAVQTSGQENAETSLQSEVTRAEQQTNAEPTEGQKEAGNYKKGRVKVGPFDVVIEQPRGSVRSGVDANGKAWETTMQHTYGYFGGTKGVDGDAIDVFLAHNLDEWDGTTVFVVDQYNPDGSFDEHKVMLGFNSQEEAEAAYFANYEADWAKTHRTEVTAVPLADFTEWVNSSKRKTKAFAAYKVAKRNAEIDAHNAQNEQLAEQLFSMAKEAETEKDFFDRAASLFEVTGYQSDLRDIYNGVKSGEIANARALSFYTNATLKPVAVETDSNQRNANDNLQQLYTLIDTALAGGNSSVDDVKLIRSLSDEELVLAKSYKENRKGRLNKAKIDVSNIRRHILDEIQERQNRKDLAKTEKESYIKGLAYFKKNVYPGFDFENYIKNKEKEYREAVSKGRLGYAAILKGVIRAIKEVRALAEQKESANETVKAGVKESEPKQATKNSKAGEKARKHAAQPGAPAVSTQEATLRDALVDVAQQSGLEVVVDEKAQQVLDEVNGKHKSVRMRMGDATETFKIRQKETADTRGVAMPGLNEASVNVVKDIPKHSYRGNIKQATREAIDAAKKKYEGVVKTYNNYGAKFDYTISGNAIEICLSPKHQGKSVNKGVHLAMAEYLDEVINNSIEVEEHPDYIKVEGKRGNDSSVNENAIMHRFYGVAIIDGTPYRVMTLMREEKSSATSNGIHSYEVQKIEVLDNELPSTSNGVGSQNQIGSSYPLANLLKDVEMSYRPGVKVLEESAKQRARLREHRVFHGSGAEFDAFDHSHMGEGEGAQAYGWGTYVTEVEGIGRMYAESYKAGMFKSGFGDSFLEELKEAAKEGKFDEVKQQLLGHYRYLYDSEKAKGVKKDDAFISDYEMLERIKEEDIPSKFLYTVEIPEDNGSNYLHWEEQPGKEQLSAVAEALKADGWSEAEGNHPTFTKGDNKIVLNERATGSDVYAELEESLGSQQKASEFLSSIGFTGISYPAEARSGGRTDAARNFVIFNEKDAQITDHIRFFRTPGGEAYGFTVDGKIYLDPRIATAETPIHEYAHLWADMIRNVNAEAWNDIVGLMKATPIWEEVRGLYPELKTDDEIADEVLAHYSGRRGAERLREAQQQAATETGKSVFERAAAVAAIERVKQALAKFWQSVAELFHIRFTSAEEVADRVLADMLNGVNPNQYIKRKGRGVQKLHLNDKTLAGIHNITEEKLRKALNLGGLANPSLAIIDTAQNKHEDFGEISLIAPSALVDKETGQTAGTWTTDAYTQRYPQVERVMSDVGFKKFNKWVESLDLLDSEKSEIKWQTKEAFESNRELSWELIYLLEKGIDAHAYTSNAPYEWKQTLDAYSSADELLDGMQKDEELHKKVVNYVKGELSKPIKEKIRGQIRQQIKNETGIAPAILPPRYRKQVTEIFNRDYAKDLFGEDLMPGEEDVKKVMQHLFDLHNRTKHVDFSLSKSKASTYVHSHDLYSDYLRWQNKKLKEFGVKGRLFRGYSADGSRKYIPETLKNVSKAMVADANGQTNGGEMVSLGSFVAKFADRVDSADEMRANKKRLATNESKQGFYSEWMPTYKELADELSDDIFAGEQRLHDIAVQDNPVKYAKKEYGITLSKSFMDKLNAFKKAIREDMTSAYFETKFERPVYLNEFAAAVIPSDLSEDVKGGLEKSGIAIYEYDPKIEGDRDRATNAAFEADNRIRFQFVGQQGAAALDKSEEATTRLDNLGVAREMERQEKDAKAIKLATGWERGGDGKWRYEIVDGEFDRNGELHPERRALSSEEQQELEEASVDLQHAFQKGISINENEMDMVELYVLGGMERSRAERLSYLEDKKYELSRLPKHLDDYLDNEELYQAYPELRNVRIVEGNRNMVLKGSFGFYDQQDKSITLYSVNQETLVHEVQHAIQYIEGFAEGGSPKFLSARRIKNIFNEVTEQIKQLRAEGKDAEADALIKKNRGLYNAYMNHRGEAFRNYKALGGEVEARNVQKRLHMTPEERRQSLAEETEDVAREDQIFIMENARGVNASQYSSSSMVSPLEMSDAEKYERGEWLRNAPAVDVESNQIVKTEHLSARKAAEKWWDEHTSSPLHYQTEIGDVVIDNNSIGNSLAHRYGQAKLDAITSLKEGFKNAVYLGSLQDFTRDGQVYNHYFAYPIQYNGERCYVFCRALHDANKNHLYVHEVFVASKIEKGNTLQTAASQPHGGIALYKDILANVLDAAKVVENSETSQGSAENNFREGKGELSDDMLSYLNDPMAQMMGKPRGTKKQRAQFAERERGRMQAHAEKLVERLHLTNVEIVTDASQLEGKQRTAKGFYNKRTEKITIVLPNHASTADVEQTLLHEAVAHYGLRQLFGEHFDDFLDMVYRNAEEGIRRKIAEASAKHGWNVRTATEEYLADLAERTDFEHASPQWWAKIKGFFLDMLRGLGFEAMDGQTLTDNELRYVLWRSYENLTEPGKYPTFIAEARDVAKQHALQVGRFAPTETAGSRVAENEALSEEETAEILFRDGNDYQYTQVLARDRYERRIKSGMYQTKEALQDSMLGLRTAMESILEAEGRKGVYIEDIDGFENAYLGENRLSSVNQAEAEKFAREQFKVSSKKVCGCNIWVRQNVVASYVLVIGKR